MTRIGLTEASSDCQSPVSVVGMGSESDSAVVLGPVFAAGTYRFCVSKDGGKVFHLQVSFFF